MVKLLFEKVYVYKIFWKKMYVIYFILCYLKVKYGMKYFNRKKFNICFDAKYVEYPSYQLFNLFNRTACLVLSIKYATYEFSMLRSIFRTFSVQSVGSNTNWPLFCIKASVDVQLRFLSSQNLKLYILIIFQFMFQFIQINCTRFFPQFLKYSKLA